MKLVKQQVEKPELNKRYLIPSIIAMGFVPLIMHEHTYRTHLENEDWFAIGNYTATDFFLFWKQWAVIILALVCLLLLLIRAKYYKEKLPWEKKAFIPLGIYCLFVFLSACFAKKPLFAWAGGYDMFQSALAILSYVVLFYYTYSCIKSMDHVLYLLRGAEIGVTIELLICFFQAIGHDPIATKVGKILVTNPSRWSNLDSLTLSPDVYGTIYNTDYLSMYLPIVVPIIVVLLVIEKQLWRKIYNACLLLLSLFVLVKGPSSAKMAIVAAVAIVFIICCTRDRKLLVSCVIMLACIVFAGASIIFGSSGYYKAKADQLWNGTALEDRDVPIKSVTTGDQNQGITVELKDGKAYRFTFSISDGKINDLTVYDTNGNPIALTESNPDNQTYVFSDAENQAEGLYFYRDDTHGMPYLMLVKDGHSFPFVDSDLYGSGDKEYYLVSTAGRCVKLPQKNNGEVYEVFHNGFWNGRGPIYNRSLPLLEKNIFIGSGADNYIMVYPQRDYILDYYLNYSSNILNVKPHSFYLQVWIQDGFIAFAAIMVFFFWYLCTGTKKFRKIIHDDHTRVIGFAIMIVVIGYLVAVIANDSTTCTAPVFWTVLGIGWGLLNLPHEQG